MVRRTQEENEGVRAEAERTGPNSNKTEKTQRRQTLTISLQHCEDTWAQTGVAVRMWPLGLLPAQAYISELRRRVHWSVKPQIQEDQ